MSRGEARSRGKEVEKDEVCQWADLTSPVEAGTLGETPPALGSQTSSARNVRPRLVPRAEQSQACLDLDVTANTLSSTVAPLMLPMTWPWDL